MQTPQKVGGVFEMRIGGELQHVRHGGTVSADRLPVRVGRFKRLIALDRGYRIFVDVEPLNGIRCPDCTGEQRAAQQARPSLGGLHRIFQDLLEIVDAADYVNLQLVESRSLEKHSVIPLTKLLYTVTIDIKYLVMRCRRGSLQLLHPRR